MPASPLIFYFRSLGLLILAALCLPQATTAQSEEQMLIALPKKTLTPNGFIVYGRVESPSQNEDPAIVENPITVEGAGIEGKVKYYQITGDSLYTDRLPDLEMFFRFGGTLELVTPDSNLRKHDIVISEIMWGTDAGNSGKETDTQWIELYSPNINTQITPELYLLFTPFESHPHRVEVTPSHVSIALPNNDAVHVLDAISNLHLGKWDLPGRSGRKPYINVVSAYRDIIYPDSANGTQGEIRVPPGSYKDSWKATPEVDRRNILLSITKNSGQPVEKLSYVATPGTRHVPDSFVRAPLKISVRSDQVVINEVRNDVSRNNQDWVELKNVGRLTVNLENWELSIVTDVGEDTDLVDLPDYKMRAGDILLLHSRHPWFTTLAGGIDIQDPEAPQAQGAIHKYFVDPRLNLPNKGRFVLLLRRESDKNGEDTAIADYAGNGFFTDTSSAFNTDFWPRKSQPLPRDVAEFGEHNTFGSFDTAWARLRYQRDDGHHRDAWMEVKTQGGVGYDPGTDLSVSPGTPGYENTALKTRVDDKNTRTPIAADEYREGDLSISEIMRDPGPNRNQAQWIELYNSSLTEAVNLEGWELKVRNLETGMAPT